MNIDCNSLMFNHLLKDNIWYSQKILLTLFLSLFISVSYCYNFKNQHIIIKAFIVPVISFIIIFYLLEVIAMAIVDKKELEYQVDKCQRLFKDPTIEDKTDITGDDVENYTGIPDNSVSDLDDNTEEMSENTEKMANVPEIGVVEETPLEISTQEEIEENMVGSEEDTEEWKNSFDNSKCQMGYGSLCSGEKVPKNLVTAIPGPQWQPQTAEATAKRLENQQYVPSKCHLHPL